MKVVYDHQIFLQEVGGISRYFYNLTTEIEKHNICVIEKIPFISKNRYFGSAVSKFYISKTGIGIVDKVFSKHTINKQIVKLNTAYTISKLNHINYDVLHVTDHDCKYLEKVKRPRPVILTVHDLIPELFPSLFPDLNERLKDRKYSIAKADHIICISESTKKDLIDIYNIPASKISMIYHGCPDYLNVNFMELEILNNKKYLMYIGDRRATYKNFWNMIENLNDFLSLHNDVFLVCIGSPFNNIEKEKLAKFSWASKVLTFSVKDSELFSIYNNSLCLILPSLYEGFGFPLLEAMKAQCPILASNTSCLPEIAAGGALYFNPITFAGFKENLQSIVEDEHQRTHLIKKQELRLVDFSWTKTADYTVQSYLKAI